MYNMIFLFVQKKKKQKITQILNKKVYTYNIFVFVARFVFFFVFFFWVGKKRIFFLKNFVFENQVWNLNIKESKKIYINGFDAGDTRKMNKTRRKKTNKLFLKILFYIKKKLNV